MNPIDRFLNSITMYSLVLYGLLAVSAYGIILDYSRALSLVIFVATCNIANLIYSKLFKIPSNAESSSITALILFLIMSPALDVSGSLISVLTGLIAISSKYLIAPLRRHIFNPAAFGAFVIFILGLSGATWWVGSFEMLPVVVIFGLLVVRKIRRFDLFLPFLASSLLSIGYFFGIFTEAILSWPVIFFGTIMLTEPITAPPTRKLRIIYAILVGLLFGSQFHVGLPAQAGVIIPTPEFVLLAGNIFSYIVGFKRRLILTLKAKSEIAKDVFEFIFISDKKIAFSPGQYLEWTLFHKKHDSRGIRRYFTIASSPTEEHIMLGVKFNKPPSSFKDKLLSMQVGDSAIAGELGGDFALPKNAKQKLAFIAGGIGITPYRSMIKYLVDKGERRDITLFYGVKSEEEIAYRYLWIEAETKIGLKTEYVAGKVIDANLIKNKLPDFKERIFYISGPEAMVNADKKMLLNMGVSRRKIVTDYFPGFA